MSLDFSEHGLPSIDQDKCTLCRRCVEYCPTETLFLEGERIGVRKKSFMGCVACGHCMTLCPTEAITVRGRRLSRDDVVHFPCETPASYESLHALFLRRRSIRFYREQEVARETLDCILKAVKTAPMGIPPTEVGVTVISGREKVRAFTENMMSAFRKALKMLNPVVLSLLSLLMSRRKSRVMKEFVIPLLKTLVSEWEKGRDTLCYDAPLVMLFHEPASGMPTDSCIAATYAMIAAEALGLSSCWIGTAVVLNKQPTLKAKYGIPQENEIGGMLILGYGAVSFERSLERRLAGVVHV